MRDQESKNEKKAYIRKKESKKERKKERKKGRKKERKKERRYRERSGIKKGMRGEEKKIKKLMIERNKEK